MLNFEELYDKYTDAFIEDKNKVVYILKEMITASQSVIDELEAQANSIPTYTSPKLPIPKITNCHFNSYDDSFGSSGSMNCYSY